MRDEHQTCLAKLNSDGSELVERYRDLLDSENLSSELRDAMQSVLSERGAVMERLAELQRGRGELPKAGDPERAFLQSLADWGRDQLLGDPGGTARRLRKAERDWLGLVGEALTLDWEEEEQRVLEDLGEHIVRTMDRLEALEGS